jgi:hypothetical protein
VNERMRGRPAARTTSVALLIVVSGALSTCSGRGDPRSCAAHDGARVCVVRHRDRADLSVQGLEPGSPGTLTRLPEQVVLRAVARANGTITVESLPPTTDSPTLRFEGTSGGGRQVAVELRWPTA